MQTFEPRTGALRPTLRPRKRPYMVSSGRQEGGISLHHPLQSTSVYKLLIKSDAPSRVRRVAVTHASILALILHAGGGLPSSGGALFSGHRR
jgi:hypothetical protein